MPNKYKYPCPKREYTYLECLKTYIFLLKKQYEELTRSDVDEVLWGEDTNGLVHDDYMQLIKRLNTRFNIAKDDEEFWDRILCADYMKFINLLTNKLLGLIQEKQAEYNQLKQSNN